MGRVNKTEGAPWFDSNSISLTDEEKERITEDILGIDTDTEEGAKLAKEVVHLVGAFLGCYRDSINSVNKAPSAVNYRMELDGRTNKHGNITNGLRKQTHDLRNTLSNMSYWMTGEFEQEGYDTHVIEKELAKFFDVSTRIRDKYSDEGSESRGKPENKSLKMLINTIREVFNKYYYIPEIGDEYHKEHAELEGTYDKTTGEKEDGRNLSGKQRAEIFFITECLEIAGIPVPQTDEGLTSLFYNDKTPPEKKLYFSAL